MVRVRAEQLHVATHHLRVWKSSEATLPVTLVFRTLRCETEQCLLPRLLRAKRARKQQDEQGEGF